ncbi:MAG TPA: hypothetical protein PLI09_16135 [Candidatus Hydrogenedentes bacterium]|nr:hypothetical protein [Candidatus Hydrogenedentota bacterium]
MSSMVKSLGLVVVIALVVAGCAGLKKKSDEEMIRETVQKVKLALESKNLDMLMETFAEDFSHDEAGDKAKAREMLQMGIDMGYADDGECNIENIQIKIDKAKGEASVYPLDLSGAPGSVSVELIMGKREAVIGGKKQTAWLITTLNADGV